MRRLLAESAALFAACLCGSLLVPSANSATLSGSVHTEVFEIFTDSWHGESCNDSQSVSGPSVSLRLMCDSSMGTSSGNLLASSAWLTGEATDVSGHVSFLAAAGGVYLEADPPQTLDTWVIGEAMASGFLYIAVPSPVVDIRFNAVDCGNCFLSVNGVFGDRFENLPTHTPLPYDLDIPVWATDVYAPDSGSFDGTYSYDLQSVTVRDHASGETLANATILFSATPIPEPGAAELFCIGLALIALGSRARTK